MRPCMFVCARVRVACLSYPATASLQTSRKPHLAGLRNEGEENLRTPAEVRAVKISSANALRLCIASHHVTSRHVFPCVPHSRLHLFPRIETLARRLGALTGDVAEINAVLSGLPGLGGGSGIGTAAAAAAEAGAGAGVPTASSSSSSSASAASTSASSSHMGRQIVR